MQFGNFIAHVERSFRIRRKGRVFLVHTLAVILSFLIVISLVSQVYVEERELAKLKKREEELQRPMLPQVTVLAEHFVVYDVTSNKILLEKKAHDVAPLASLTKVKTAYLYLKRNGPGGKIVIPNLGEKHMYDFTLKPGDVWVSSELIKYMLTISSNDAAEILAMNDPLGRDGFIKEMNGSNDSTTTEPLVFTTPSGLDSKESTGGIGSALGVAELVKKFYKTYPEYFEATTKAKVSVKKGSESLRGIPNTNQDVETYRGISGSKTGFTDKAGGNLAILYDSALGNPLIIVILGSTKEGRFDDMRTLLDYVNTYHSQLYQEEK